MKQEVFDESDIFSKQLFFRKNFFVNFLSVFYMLTKNLIVVDDQALSKPFRQVCYNMNECDSKVWKKFESIVC